MEFEVVKLPEPKVPETGLSKTGRTGLRTVARAGEAVLGLPGDILQTVGGGLTQARKYFNPEENVPEFKSILPTSADIRAGHKQEFGEYLEPQTSGEQFYDDVVQDVSLLALPFGKTKLPFKSAVLRGIGANVASGLAKEVGYGEAGQAGAKLGFLTIAGLRGGRSALEKKMQQDYVKVGELAQGKTHNATSLESSLKNLSKSAYSGHETPVKKFIKSPLDSVQSSIRDGKINVADAVTLEKDVHELLRDPGTPKAAKPLLRKISGGINGVLEGYGKTNKEFGKVYNESTDIWKALNLRNDVDKFFQGLGEKSRTARILGKLGGKSAYDTLSTIAKSPTAQKYYAGALKGGLEKNAAVAQRNLLKLDKELSKDETGDFEVLSLG